MPLWDYFSFILYVSIWGVNFFFSGCSISNCNLCWDDICPWFCAWRSTPRKYIGFSRRSRWLFYWLGCNLQFPIWLTIMLLCGNLVLTTTFGDAVLLDHGIYRELDERFRLNYCELWKALIWLDSKKIQHLGEKFGVGNYSKYFPVIFTGRTIQRWGFNLQVCIRSCHFSYMQ